MKGTGFSPYIRTRRKLGFSPWGWGPGAGVLVVSIPSAAKACDRDPLLAYGLKPVPFDALEARRNAQTSCGTLCGARCAERAAKYIDTTVMSSVWPKRLAVWAM
jgi:hypothetical protein